MTEPLTKRPSFPWYPGDHRRDAGVQACSIGARGIWREMLDLMHDGEPYGHLTAGGVAITINDLSRMVGVPLSETKRYLKELEDRKVFSRTPKNVIYSRRMVKDDVTRRMKKAAGSLGGNPALRRQGDNQPDIHPLNQSGKREVNQQHIQAPARAVAVASPSTHPPAIAAFVAALPDGHNAQHWTAIIEGWQQGMGFEGGKAASADDVATGLTEYLAKADRDFAVIHVRSFVERARRNRLKAGERVTGKHAEVATRIWSLIKSQGIHHRTTEREIDTEVTALVTAGKVKNAGEFKTILKKLDFEILKKAQQESFAVRHIAERLNGASLGIA